MTFAALGSHRATGRTITEQFHAFDARNPHVSRALERMAARRLAAGATRISLKDFFEDLRRQLPDGVAGLNNNFTALYARRLIDDHPHWLDAFELRRRRAALRHPLFPALPSFDMENHLLSARPVVLVVAPGDESYRRYCLEQVADAYRVVLLTGAEPSWEKPHITDHAVVDLSDPAALLAGGRALAERHDLAGVMTWDEWSVVPTARLARQLGLTTTAPEVMQGCRNKATARSLFARHGVPSAASVSVRTRQEAEAAAERIGYPVVLKPASHAGAIGVRRVDDRDQLTAAYQAAERTAGQGTESTSVLVEEFLDGPEISVECVTYRGTTTVVAVNRKTISPPPHFEQLAHSVDADDPLRETVAPAARAAINALGISDGVSHIEMRLVEGRPRLIEVNARLAGDMIGHLVRLATGIDLVRAAADIACDRAPELTPTRSSAAAIHLLYPDTSGTLTRLTYDGPRPNWLDRVQFQCRPGDQLLLPADGGNLYTGRIGYLITTATTGQQARTRADHAARAVTAVLDQTPGTAA